MKFRKTSNPLRKQKGNRPMLEPFPRMKEGDIFGGFVVAIEWLGGYPFAKFESRLDCFDVNGSPVAKGTTMRVKISAPLNLENTLKTGDLFSVKVEGRDVEKRRVPVFRVLHKPSE